MLDASNASSSVAADSARAGLGVVHRRRLREVPPERPTAIGEAGVPQLDHRPLAVRHGQFGPVLRIPVNRHLVSDRPVALFLSGGFDSALIASQIVKAPNPPTAITIDSAAVVVPTLQAVRMTPDAVTLSSSQSQQFVARIRFVGV